MYADKKKPTKLVGVLEFILLLGSFMKKLVIQVQLYTNSPNSVISQIDKTEHLTLKTRYNNVTATKRFIYSVSVFVLRS